MIEPKLNYVWCPGAAASPVAGHEAAHRMAYWEWNATGNPDHPHVLVCVHGLTRQSRDFDVLAQHLAPHMRVVCPDVVGRGHSDWLANPAHYQVPQYAADMLALLAQLHANSPITRLDWVGTSMGGLIGMALAGQPLLPAPLPFTRLVLNDVGPALEWPALSRIASYVGQNPRFDSVEQGAEALWRISSGFGPHSQQEWLALSRPMLRPRDDGGWGLHYDPAIGQAFQHMTPESAPTAEQALWQLYDQISARTLVLRGAQSDLLSAATARAMTERGPRAQLVEFAAVGHAPTLVTPDQVAVVSRFLLETA
jgi:pimeloyl-ACP methyl ester carboxylesterase